MMTEFGHALPFVGIWALSMVVVMFEAHMLGLSKWKGLLLGTLLPYLALAIIPFVVDCDRPKESAESAGEPRHDRPRLPGSNHWHEIGAAFSRGWR